MSNSANRLKRHGSTVKVWELRCPLCQRGLLLTDGEAAPLHRGLVPYCHDCDRPDRRAPMTYRRYRSGPITLIV